MGRILFDTATTINGFIADESNSLAWLFAVENGSEPDDELLPQGTAVMVEGSTTYEWVLAESDILAHPERWQEFHGTKPTFVFTSRDLPVPEGVEGASLMGELTGAAPLNRAYLHGEHSGSREQSNQWIVTPHDKYIWFTRTGEIGRAHV